MWDKKPDHMIPQALKACFKILFKLYNNLEADYNLTIQDKEKNPDFLQCLICWPLKNFLLLAKTVPQDDNEFVKFFQISTDQPVCEQSIYEAAEKI